MKNMTRPTHKLAAPRRHYIKIALEHGRPSSNVRAGLYFTRNTSISRRDRPYEFFKEAIWTFLVRRQRRGWLVLSSDDTITPLISPLMRNACSTRESARLHFRVCAAVDAISTERKLLCLHENKTDTRITLEILQSNRALISSSHAGSFKRLFRTHTVSSRFQTSPYIYGMDEIKGHVFLSAET